MKRFFIAAIALLTISVTLYGAPRRRSKKVHVPPKLEELPKLPMDTIDTKEEGVKVIIFSNNTWSYYYPTKATEYAGNSVFNNFWDTTQVFAYKGVELIDLPKSIDLKLIDNDSDFHYPVKGRVYSVYGPRGRRNHNGVDIPLKMGEPVYSIFEGKVRYSRYNKGGFGNLVIVRHPNGLESWYAHLTRCNVAVNDVVKAGEVIGFGGSTGRSRGPHLHFELRYTDQTFDPQRLLDFENGRLKYNNFVLEKSFFNIHSKASDQLIEDDDDELLLVDDSMSSSLIEDLASGKTFREQNMKEAAIVAPSQTEYYTVKKGDFLGKIASKTGVSVNQICRLNGIKANSKLRIGQRLKIGGTPSGTSTTKTSSGDVYHTIKSGDTLSGIAARYGTSVDKICSLNGITRVTKLHIGRRLKIK